MMKCKFCGNEMVLNDIDYNFPGNKDNYWLCEKCHASAVEKIRYGRTINVKFEEPETDFT